MPVFDNETWFINGNYETACIEQHNGHSLVTIRDMQDTVIYRGNF